jgi:hypothetical protein
LGNDSARLRLLFPQKGQFRKTIPFSSTDMVFTDISLTPFSLDNTEWVVIHNEEYPDL